MSFDDKEYAQNVWTPDKIARLESDWLKQQEGWYKLLEPLIPRGNNYVLDVGCGIGIYYNLLINKVVGCCKERRYIGIDPVENMIKRAIERHPLGDFRVGSVFNISFPDRIFDLVFCWSVLIHLPYNEVEKAIRELWRVTRRNLFLNLYVALEDDNFSVKGSWAEYLTAVNGEWVNNLLSSLNPEPKSVEVTDYEGVEMLGGKKFQRKIYLLRLI